MVKEQVQVRELQEGNYILVDETPCKIHTYTTSKPGKHGSAKANMEAKEVFGDGKHRVTQPVDAKVWQPIVNRKTGQVVSVDEDKNEAQIMDLESYETFPFSIPEDEDLQPDENIEYLEYEGSRKIVE